MKIPLLIQKQVKDPKNNFSTAEFAEKYLGLKLWPYQKLLLNWMDFGCWASKRCTPKRCCLSKATTQRGYRSNILIRDDFCDHEIDL